MGISLADDCSINMTHFVVHLHLIDCYCDSMRDLLIQAVQCFLADNLCHYLALRLVCDCIFIIELRSVWKIFHNYIYKLIRIIASSCRYRNDFCKITFLTICINKSKNLFLLHHINFIDNKNNRCLYLL